METSCTLPEFTFDEVSYVYPTWEQMGEYSFELGEKILGSRKSFNIIVALAKGGLTWARTLADHLEIDRLVSTRIKTYHGIGQTAIPVITEPLSVPVHGQDVLLFDEVIDSGITIKVALEYLFIMQAKSVTVASLCYKPKSTKIPDFSAFSTDAWVIFPHELREFVVEVYHTWTGLGYSLQTIVDRLVLIGLPEHRVRSFIQRLNQQNPH